MTSADCHSLAVDSEDCSSLMISYWQVFLHSAAAAASDDFDDDDASNNCTVFSSMPIFTFP